MPSGPSQNGVLSYFNSPIAYIITVFLILAGLQFFFGFLTLDSFGSTQVFSRGMASLRLF